MIWLGRPGFLIRFTKTKEKILLSIAWSHLLYCIFLQVKYIMKLLKKWQNNYGLRELCPGSEYYTFLKLKNNIIECDFTTINLSYNSDIHDASSNFSNDLLYVSQQVPVVSHAASKLVWRIAVDILLCSHWTSEASITNKCNLLILHKKKLLYALPFRVTILSQ